MLLTLLAQNQLLLLAIVVRPFATGSHHGQTGVIWVVGLALGPVGECNIAFVDPVERREVVLDGAQPNGQLDVPELDQIMQEFALSIRFDAQ